MRDIPDQYGKGKKNFPFQAIVCVQSPTPNAFTLAISGRKPFIVLHTALLELLTTEEVQVGTLLNFKLNIFLTFLSQVSIHTSSHPTALVNIERTVRSDPRKICLNLGMDLYEPMVVVIWAWQGQESNRIHFLVWNQLATWNTNSDHLAWGFCMREMQILKLEPKSGKRDDGNDREQILVTTITLQGSKLSRFWVYDANEASARGFKRRAWKGPLEKDVGKTTKIAKTSLQPA
jgi:hypothetical protein